MTNAEITWFAVVNPNAGSGKTLAKWRDAEALLFKKGIRYNFAIPESSRDSSRRIKTACYGGFRHFIAVGGDGTIHHVMKAIISFIDDSRQSGRDVTLSDFTLAVLPIGSGNDWIKSHNVPANYERIVDLIADESFAFQDVIKAELIDPETGSVTKVAYMANIGGYGFDAGICDVVNFQKANGVTGKLIYVNAIRRQITRIFASPTKVLCDSRLVFDGMAYSMSLGNGKYSGGGLVQTPDAVIDDGILDITIIPKFSWFKIILYLHKFIHRQVKEIPILQFHRGKTIEIIPEGLGQLVEVDGEILGRAPVRFTVMPEQIKVLDARV